jgi:hypothetical protein
MTKLYIAEILVTTLLLICLYGFLAWAICSLGDSLNGIEDDEE